METRPSTPRLGVQAPVVAFDDPWAEGRTDSLMRTGTGVVIASQDPPPTPADLIAALQDLGAEFYVHHVIPGQDDNSRLIADLKAAGIGLVLGNEYGNINGPFAEGANRYDVSGELIADAAGSGVLAGVLYDEPEHLQIHAGQYRKDAFLPHFGDTTGMTAPEAIAVIEDSVGAIVSRVDAAARPTSAGSVPVLAEHVFPNMFHVFARAGMTPAPKVMKESFQPLQLTTALGAAIQYRRQLWLCVDLWGPDIGPWFTRAPGLPGHSPAEFASALRMAYLFAPTALFVENIDTLVTHDSGGFLKTEFGEVWSRFVREYIPATPVTWSHDQARADIVLIHAEDSDFGRHTQPFGNRLATAPAEASSVFEAWHLLSHGSIPAHGSCQHIPGYENPPRALLNSIPRSDFPLAAGADEQTRVHGLFHAARNVLVFDEHVRSVQLGDPALILVVGSRLPRATLKMLRSRAESGATVVIAEWLAADPWRRTQRVGSGRWVVFATLMDHDVQEACAPHLGSTDEWIQRFGDTEIRFTPGDAHGETLGIEITRAA